MTDGDGLSLEGYPNVPHSRGLKDFVVLTLRIREELRVRLAAAAESNGNSLNYEIALRLLQSLDGPDLEARIEAAVRRGMNGHAK